MKIIYRVTQVFLALMGLAFCRVGIDSLIDPVPVLANVGVELNNISALSSMRAVYGGMHLAFGLFCFYGIFKHTRIALVLVVLYTAGFVLGRVSGILVDGNPNEFVLTWLTTEIISLAIAIFLLIKFKPATS